MMEVEEGFEATGMRRLPDGGLKEMDPRDIEKVIAQEIERIQPNVVATYPVHGISGFHDHLITHAVVKRVYVELKEKEKYLKRLAFITLPQEAASKSKHFPLSGSTDDEIDCIVEVNKKILKLHTLLGLL